MNTATVTDINNYEMKDSSGNPITLTNPPIYDESTYQVTLTPVSTLDWATNYIVTVKSSNPGEIEDFNGTLMGTDDTITFTTRKQYPDFTEPTMIKNRIGSGTNSEALIFIPQPPGGASARVSVQVFTTTGKLVRTFYKNVPWSTIGASPISWDGTNDRGDNLGPGMYFVQVRTESYKRVLKVMIVR